MDALLGSHPAYSDPGRNRAFLYTLSLEEAPVALHELLDVAQASPGTIIMHNPHDHSFGLILEGENLRLAVRRARLMPGARPLQ